MAKSIKIPQFTGGNITAQSTYRAPTPGSGATKIVENITKIATKLDTEIASQEAYKKGLTAQQEATERGENYVGPANAYSVTAQAFQKGANAAFITSKSAELENELTQLSEKHSLDPEKFTTASEQYKENWLSTLPSNLQPQLALGFDKARNNLLLQVQANQRTDQFNQNLEVIQNNTNDIVRKLSLSVTNQGYTDTLQDYFADLEVKYEVLKQDFNLSVSDMRKLKNSHRTDIINAFITADFDKVKDSPEGIAALKKSIADGTYTLDGNPLGDPEEGYAFAIPGGDVLTLDEISTYGSVVESLETDNKKRFVGLRNELEFTQGKVNEQLANAEIGIKIVDGKLQATSQIFPVETWQAAGFSDEEITKAQREFMTNKRIGEARAQTIITPLAQINTIKFQIQNRINELDASKYEDALKIDLIEKQLAAVEEEQKAKLKAFEPGNNPTDYFIGKLGYEVDTTTAEGSALMEKIIAENVGVPPGGMRVSKVQGQIEMNAIYDSMVQGYDSYVQQVYNIRNRQKAYTSSYMSEGIGSKNHDKYSHMFLQELITLPGSNPVDSKLLFDAINNSETYAKFRSTEFTESDVKSAINTLISDNFGDAIDGTGGFGKSIIDTTHKIFRKNIANGMSLSEATEDAKAFIERNTVRIEHGIGEGFTIMSRNMANGQFTDADGNNAGRQNTITSIANDIKENPHRYGISLADGQTYEQWLDLLDDAKLVQVNGQLVLLMNNDISSTVITQKLPSSETDNFYATFFVTPDKNNAVVAENKEFTWNYKPADNNWYSKFAASNTGKSKRLVSTGLEPYEDGPVEIDFDDTVAQWGDKFAQYLRQNNLLYAPVDPQGNFGGPQQSTYEDSFTKNLFLNNGATLVTTDQFVANGISLALKNSNNVDDAMLAWLGANSTYLSSLKDSRVRSYVKKYWKENFEQIQNLTTNNDMPVQMSVLQALTDVVRTAPVFTVSAGEIQETQDFGEGGA